MKRTSLVVTALIVALAGGACSSEDSADTETTETTAAPTETTEAMEEATTTTAAMEEPGTIVDVAASTEGFSTLVAAVKAAGLVETLSGDEEFTVFAPTDEAFAAALTKLNLTADALLADKETLTSILTYHVVPGKVMAADVVGLNGKDAATVNGKTVKGTVNGDKVMINDATVTTADVEASNGVIHVIDTVLVPGS